MTHLHLSVFSHQKLVYSDRLTIPMDLGRQRGDEHVMKLSGDNQIRRLPIVVQEDTSVPRDFVRIEPLNPRMVRVTNLHSTVAVHLDSGPIVPPHGVQEFAVPILIVIGNHAIRVEAIPDQIDSQGEKYNSLDGMTIAPGGSGSARPSLPSLSPNSPDALIAWFQAVISVLETAGGEADFFERAACAIVESIRLDSGAVVLWDAGTWKISAYHNRQGDDSNSRFRPSQHILAQVRDQKRTFWQVPSQIANAIESLADVQAFVAAPILNREGNVLGVLYGDRRRVLTAPTMPQITRLEAQLVETLACSVAAGLVRLHEEREALRARLTFEQFFTPELSQSLAREPDLLDGRDAEVSILFCDIRGFSRASEQLGPGKTLEWIQSVMGALSDCVVAHNGVLVDYIGDELMAMWGAPVAQPDHAVQACRAAIDMMHTLPALNAEWKSVLKEPFRVGIGINTGMARVGNTGSYRKFKYGPLGNTVNLASRVQGATKYLKADLLVTAATFAKLPPDLEGRRLCAAQVLNISAPVELFEINPQADATWRALKKSYEEALQALETGQYRRATGLLAHCLNTYPDDGPSLVLLARAVDSLVDPERATGPVWTLPGK